MHPLLEPLLRAQQVCTTAEAAACGVDATTLARMVGAGQLHRVHYGAFVDATTWAAASPEQQHLLRCRAVLPRYHAAALSHTSAVVAHELPTYRADLRTVHVSRRTRGRTGRVGRLSAVQVHPRLAVDAFAAAGAPPALPVCTPAVAVLQLADWHGLEAGMVAAEAGLHRGTITRTGLQRARQLVRLGRGRANADHVVRLAGDRSDSPGETLTRLLLRSLQFADAEQQVRIRLPGGGVARVDFLLTDLGVVVEFDGAVKYEGAQGRAALVREKRREDGIRAAGYPVVRLTWSDLGRPARVRDLLLRAAASRRQ